MSLAVSQLRYIADHVIGGNNPNLADVLKEFAGILEQDMAAAEDPVPLFVLVRVADVRRAVDLAWGHREEFAPRPDEVDRLLDAIAEVTE